MSRLSTARLSHFIPSLMLLGAGLAAAHVKDLSVFFTSLFNVLPTLVLLLGGTYCLVYQRQRELFLMITVYSAYSLLDLQADYYRDTGQVRDDAAVVFHLVSLLLPLLYGVFALWHERTHLAQGLLTRSVLLLGVGAVAYVLVKGYPDGVLRTLAQIRWPGLHADWMRLIQLAYPAFFIVTAALIVQYLRRPRALHAALVTGVVGLFWMLPQTFILPFTLNIVCSQVMLMIATAVAHEAYQMAFRDELTGLPGRRALNERMQRLGRHYVLVMADVDHFKRFNDTHGHDVGDQVLQLVASRLAKVGGGGRVYRYGGEEFAVVFAGKTVQECIPHLEAVRETIADYAMVLRDPGSRPQDDAAGRKRRDGKPAGSVGVTLSLGVAERRSEQRLAEEVLRCADQALYVAKASGRNCVAVAGEKPVRGAVKTE